MPNVFFSRVVGLPGLSPRSVLQNPAGGSQSSALDSSHHGVVGRIFDRFRISSYGKPESHDGTFSKRLLQIGGHCPAVD
jgi:hypothetical protein